LFVEEVSVEVKQGVNLSDDSGSIQDGLTLKGRLALKYPGAQKIS